MCGSKGTLPSSENSRGQPLEVLAMDFTQLEPVSDGQENLLVLTDVFTKFTVAIQRDQKAATVAKALIGEWFMVYGVPQRLTQTKGDPLGPKSLRNSVPSTT